jgi:triphosphatase
MRRTPSKQQPRPRVEREHALDGPREVIEALAVRGPLGPMLFGPARAARVREVYYDTPGGALADAGVTLSLSARGDGFAQRVDERRDSLAAGFVERAVSEARLTTSDPEPAQRARVRALCAESKLNPQLEIERTLTTRRIAFERSAIALRLELGEARTAPGALPIGRAILVLQRGAPAALFRAALLLLAEHPELRTAREDTPQLLARARGAAPAPITARSLALARNAALRALVDAVLTECLHWLARSEAAVRLAPESEAIHGMRVAVRRFRSALRLLRAPLGRARAERLRAALSPLADALGEVRDLDVFLEQISVCEARGAPSLVELRTRVAREREQARGALLSLLESAERAQLDLELGLLVFGHDWCDDASPDLLAVPATDAARSLAEQADSRPRRAARDLATLTPEERHRLRLRVKAARYAVELLAPLLRKKRARRYVSRARALQDALGVECDATRARFFRSSGASSSTA